MTRTTVGRSAIALLLAAGGTQAACAETIATITVPVEVRHVSGAFNQVRVTCHPKYRDPVTTKEQDYADGKFSIQDFSLDGEGSYVGTATFKIQREPGPAVNISSAWCDLTLMGPSGKYNPQSATSSFPDIIRAAPGTPFRPQASVSF